MKIPESEWVRPARPEELEKLGLPADYFLYADIWPGNRIVGRHCSGKCEGTLHSEYGFKTQHQWMVSYTEGRFEAATCIYCRKTCGWPPSGTELDETGKVTGGLKMHHIRPYRKSEDGELPVDESQFMYIDVVDKYTKIGRAYAGKCAVGKHAYIVNWGIGNTVTSAYCVYCAQRFSGLPTELGGDAMPEPSTLYEWD